MIASQKIGKSFMGALAYNIKKLNYSDANKRAELLDTNFTSLSLERIKAEVDLIRQYRPNLNRYVYHTSLNFTKEELPLLNNELLIAIARDYLEANGFTNNQYLIFRHYDTDHPHLHLLVNRITFDGKVVSDSNNYKKSEAILRRLEYQYNLLPVEQSSFRAVERDSNITMERSNDSSIERDNNVTVERYNNRSVNRNNSGATDRYNNVKIEQGKNVTVEQNNAIAIERSKNVAVERNRYVTRRPPTKDEVGMIIRTGKTSSKLLLQEILLQLIKTEPESMTDFINRAEKAGVRFLFNIASTGRISGITYFFRDFKSKGQALGSSFKWAELIRQIPYSKKDTNAIREANNRTLQIYGALNKGLPMQETDVKSVQKLPDMDSRQRIEDDKVIEGGSNIEGDFNAALNDVRIDISDDEDDAKKKRKRRL